MPTDRVLVEIATAANMTGIKEAQAGFLGMNNSLTALVAGIGLAAVAGKSIIDITEKREKADLSLAQAIKAQNGDLQEANAFLANFIDTNRSYISSQADVISGYAALIREGVSAKNAQEALGIALNIAAVQGISLTEAVLMLQAAEAGRNIGLKKLVGLTLEAIPANATLAEKEAIVAHNMEIVAAAYRHGTDATTQTDQATNRLSNDWQDIANIAGPPLLGLLDGVLKGADKVLAALKRLGENKDWANAMNTLWGGIDNTIIGIIQDVENTWGVLSDFFSWLGMSNARTGHGPIIRGMGGSASIGGRAGGVKAASGFDGMVHGPTMFLAGEAGSEHVRITPHGQSSGGITININNPIGGDGPYWDQVANRISQRLSYATGR